MPSPLKWIDDATDPEFVISEPGAWGSTGPAEPRVKWWPSRKWLRLGTLLTRLLIRLRLLDPDEV